MSTLRPLAAGALAVAFCGCNAHPPLPAATLEEGKRLEGIAAEILEKDPRVLEACKSDAIATRLASRTAQPAPPNAPDYAWLKDKLSAGNVTDGDVSCCNKGGDTCAVLTTLGKGSRRPALTLQHQLSSEASRIYYDASKGAMENLAAYEMTAKAGDEVVAKVAMSWMP